MTAAVALLFPAAALSAAFPSSSVWLSDTSPAVGDKVRIHAVVYNETSATLTGSVVFLVEEKENGTKAVSLEPGESEVVSSLWTAAEGEHSFSARFSGEANGPSTVSASVSVKVSAPPSPAALALSDAKTVTAKVASTSIPIVSAVASTVFEATESIREAGIEYLEKAVADSAVTPAKSESSPRPAVLGTTTVSQVEGFEGSSTTQNSGVFATAKHAAASGLLAIFKSFWLFYPLLVLALLFIFRSLYRWATGPRI